MTRRLLNRRRFLGLGAAALAAGLTPGLLASLAERGRAQNAAERAVPADRRYLFVVGASGGASIIDSFLPLPSSAVEAPGDPETLVSYPDALLEQPAGSNLRCVANVPTSNLFVTDYHMVDFLRAHFQDMAVLPVLNSSVNHIVAQERAINGAGVNAGKTIMEAVAEAHGADQPLPNANMAFGGYIRPGGDPRIDARYRSEIIADPLLYAASTHGYKGVDGAPAEPIIAQARALRERLDDASRFGVTFRDAKRRNAYLKLRRESLPQIEANGLIQRLMLQADSPSTPLSQYGLEPLPEAERTRLLEHFPRMMDDTLQAQGALAFLLARYDVSSSIALGPGFMPIFLEEIFGTPLAFDFSHTDHVVTQYTMWGRVLQVVDGLIRLLKTQPVGDDPSQGTLWERSVIYIATDFGRDKTRPRGALNFGSGHHLNNGNLIISPLIKGNRVFGGIDPITAETFGDRGDGARTTFREAHLYSAVAHLMGVDFQGREDMSFILRG